MTTTSDIWIIVDSSGSMVEGQRLYLARSIVREIEQCARFGYLKTCQIHLAKATGSVVEEMAWNTDEEIPSALLDAGEAVRGTGIADFIKAHDGRFVVVTDGFWGRIVRDAIKLVAEERKGFVRIIKVGRSAKYLHGDYVFSAEEPWRFLEGWT